MWVGLRADTRGEGPSQHHPGFINPRSDPVRNRCPDIHPCLLPQRSGAACALQLAREASRDRKGSRHGTDGVSGQHWGPRGHGWAAESERKVGAPAKRTSVPWHVNSYR